MFEVLSYNCNITDLEQEDERKEQEMKFMLWKIRNNCTDRKNICELLNDIGNERKITLIKKVNKSNLFTTPIDINYLTKRGIVRNVLRQFQNIYCDDMYDDCCCEVSIQTLFMRIINIIHSRDSSLLARLDGELDYLTNIQVLFGLYEYIFDFNENVIFKSKDNLIFFIDIINSTICAKLLQYKSLSTMIVNRRNVLQKYIEIVESIIEDMDYYLYRVQHKRISFIQIIRNDTQSFNKIKEWFELIRFKLHPTKYIRHKRKYNKK